MPTLPIDADALPILSAGKVEIVQKWAELSDGSRRPTGEQDRDDQNRHLWRVHVIIPAVDEKDRPEMTTVTVAAMDEPRPGPMASPVRFLGLRVRASVNRRTNALAMYWAADGIATAQGKTS